MVLVVVVTLIHITGGDDDSIKVTCHIHKPAINFNSWKFLPDLPLNSHQAAPSKIDPTAYHSWSGFQGFKEGVKL